MIEYLIEMEPVFLSLLPTLIAIWLGFRLGLVTYFKKMERDQIRNRYLENCVDLLLTNTSHALSIYKRNWRIAVNTLSEFRLNDLRELHLEKKKPEMHFLDIDQNMLSGLPFYKINTLVGDDVFWEAYQLLFAFVDTTYYFFRYNFKTVIEAYFDPDVNTVSPEEIYNMYKDKLKEIENNAKKYYIIQTELMHLVAFLETNTITQKKIESFRKKNECKEMINKLRSDLVDNAMMEIKREERKLYQ